jgi:hypothetical protein
MTNSVLVDAVGNLLAVLPNQGGKQRRRSWGLSREKNKGCLTISQYVKTRVRLEWKLYDSRKRKGGMEKEDKRLERTRGKCVRRLSLSDYDP